MVAVQPALVGNRLSAAVRLELDDGNSVVVPLVHILDEPFEREAPRDLEALPGVPLPPQPRGA